MCFTNTDIPTELIQTWYFKWLKSERHKQKTKEKKNLENVTKETKETKKQDKIVHRIISQQYHIP